MIDLLPLVNKTVEFAYRGARLGFDLSHALFSSFAIDTGTRLLLKEIAHDEVITGAASILDSGCGTGIIGISLAASCPSARVVMRDRDLLACAFSERNCWKNGIPARRLDLNGKAVAPISKKPPKHKANAERKNEVIIAPGLLGEDDPFGPFDAVVSNLPAKAGPAVLAAFVGTCAKKLLNPGGRLAFVIVNTLAGLADSWPSGSGMVLVKKTPGRSHTVYILEKEGGKVPVDSAEISGEPRSTENIPIPSFEERAGGIGFYVRSTSKRRIGRYTVQAQGFWGLPEFDTTSYATELAVDALEKATAGCLVRDFLVSGPGIGLAALWACKTLGPVRVRALSRDLLSLFAACANIKSQESSSAEFLPCASFDSDSIGAASLDCVLWIPDEIPEYDAIPPTWDFFLRSAKRGAGIVIVSSPTVIARFEKARPAGLQRLGEKKKKGFAALMVLKT